MRRRESSPFPFPRFPPLPFRSLARPSRPVSRAYPRRPAPLATRALIFERRKPVVGNPGNRVARKSEPFVALARKFVGVRAVSESRLEKDRVSEPVSEFPFDRREGAFARSCGDRLSRSRGDGKAVSFSGKSNRRGNRRKTVPAADAVIAVAEEEKVVSTPALSDVVTRLSPSSPVRRRTIPRQAAERARPDRLRFPPKPARILRPCFQH